MARSVNTTTILNIFKVFVYFQVALFITLIRGYVISTSSFRLTLFVTVLVLTFLSPAHAEKDLSLFEFFVTILTSTSSFVISESPVIVILILTDSSLISNVKPWLERFLVNPSSLGTSINIGLESNGPQAPIWPELPKDMIGEIENRIPNFKDIKAILTFCNPCSSACLETTSWSLFPWLMLSDKLDSDLRCFINLCNNKCYLLKIPTIHEKRCWGSPLGLVVTMGADYVSHLVHLMSGELIDLPPLPLDTIGLAGRDPEWFHRVHNFILFKDPPHNLSFLVIAIFGPVNSLAFTRVGGGAALNRRGQGKWVIVANPENLKFEDVTRSNDQMYALCDHGKLVHFELDDPEAEVRVISPPPEDLWEWGLQKLYLVGIKGNLFSVFRYGHDDPLMGHKTTSFSVYKFNFNASEWKEVTDLEDHAVFVGDGNSWCCPTSTMPSRSNCIYFTDDNWEWNMDPGVPYGGSDVGVFDMKTSSPTRLTFCEDNPRFYSRITFVIPKVCLN